MNYTLMGWYAFTAQVFLADIGRKLNVHKTFRKRPEHFPNVLCTFSLRPVYMG